MKINGGDLHSYQTTIELYDLKHIHSFVCAGMRVCDSQWLYIPYITGAGQCHKRSVFSANAVLHTDTNWQQLNSLDGGVLHSAI